MWASYPRNRVVLASANWRSLLDWIAIRFGVVVGNWRLASLIPQRCASGAAVPDDHLLKKRPATRRRDLGARGSRYGRRPNEQPEVAQLSPERYSAAIGRPRA